MIAIITLWLGLQFIPQAQAARKVEQVKMPRLDSLIQEMNRKFRVLDSLDTVKAKGMKWHQQHPAQKKAS